MSDLEEKNKRIIEKAKKKFKNKPISLISQQCIGGVIYHDMEMQFLSPTINLYFEAKDFIKFVEKLKYYINLPIKVTKIEDKIIGYLDDIKIIFLHYKTIEDAKTKWEERKKRILWNKLFIICTDRDGFDEECFIKLKKLNYPKALITRNAKWKKEDFVIYLEQYQEEKYVPDTIPKREFYQENKIIKLINKML